MTVKELIKKLSKLDPDLSVEVQMNDEWHSPLECVKKTRDGLVVLGWDCASYFKEQW